VGFILTPPFSSAGLQGRMRELAFLGVHRYCINTNRHQCAVGFHQCDSLLQGLGILFKALALRCFSSRLLYAPQSLNAVLKICLLACWMSYLLCSYPFAPWCIWSFAQNSWPTPLKLPQSGASVESASAVLYDLDDFLHCSNSLCRPAHIRLSASWFCTSFVPST